MNDAIAFCGVGKRYTPQQSPTIVSADFTVARGSVFGLLGANGSGKTTLLKMIAVLVTPTCGAITIEGIDAVARPRDVRPLIGLALADERSFYYRLTGRQNLQFFGEIAGLRGAQLAARIADTVERVDLAGDIDRRYATYSAGMRHRLSVARAVLARRPIVVLDEPTLGVDPAHAADIRRYVRQEVCSQYGGTVVLATNDLAEAWSICDRIGVIRDGRVDGSRTPAELYGGPALHAVENAARESATAFETLLERTS